MGTVAVLPGLLSPGVLGIQASDAGNQSGKTWNQFGFHGLVWFDLSSCIRNCVHGTKRM